MEDLSNIIWLYKNARQNHSRFYSAAPLTVHILSCAGAESQGRAVPKGEHPHADGEKLPTILIGAGRLGSAVSSFISRDTNGYKLLGVFDVNPDLIGREMCGVPILPLSDLEKFCTEHHPEVAVLCVPRQSAMDLAGELVEQGIKGFWNFSHYDLSVEYPDVTVENVHLGDSLMSLGYRLRNQEK